MNIEDFVGKFLMFTAEIGVVILDILPDGTTIFGEINKVAVTDQSQILWWKVVQSELDEMDNLMYYFEEQHKLYLEKFKT